MTFSAKNELKKLDEYYPNSDLVHIYKKHRESIIKLLETIEDVWTTKQIEKTNFEVLYDGLKNACTVVFYYVVGEQINLMIGKIVGAEQLIFKGIEDKSWRVRFNTVVIMKGLEKGEIKRKIVELGLKDKSEKVIEMALDVKRNYFD